MDFSWWADTQTSWRLLTENCWRQCCQFLSTCVSTYVHDLGLINEETKRKTPESWKISKYQSEWNCEFVELQFFWNCVLPSHCQWVLWMSKFTQKFAGGDILSGNHPNWVNWLRRSRQGPALGAFRGSDLGKLTKDNHWRAYIRDTETRNLKMVL